jgi:6-phosphofructokinase 1
MNAAIRAVVRSGINHGITVYGIRHGYEGLMNADLYEMTTSRVTDIIQRGGTMLRTARCPAMMTADGPPKVANVVKTLQLDAVVIIGGDGSFRGALTLSKLGVNVMGIPATIDMDMACTEYTIGFDTAVNTGIEAINRIRDTSFSHGRCSVVEVMGRNAGYLALWCGLTGGAEEVLYPECQNEMDIDAVIRQITHNRALGKKHHLIVVAEGVGGSSKLAREIEKVLGLETRALILGHLQRGGTPTALDRMHASVMGCLAVDSIQQGNVNKAVIFRDGRHLVIDLEDAINNSIKPAQTEMYEMLKTLAL